MAKIPTARFIRKPYGLIMLVFRYRNQKVQLSTRYYVNDPKDWNDDKKSKSRPYQRAIEQEGKPELGKVNRELDRLSGLCKDIYKDYGHGAIDPVDFKKELGYRAGFEERPKEKTSISFIEFLDIYLKMRKDEKMKANSLRPLRLHANNLRKFAAECGQFDFKDIDWNFRKKYIKWMEEKGFKLGYGNKSLSVLRHFSEAAKKDGYHNNGQYVGSGWTVSPASDVSEPITLTKNELNRLAEAKLSGTEEIVRDLFLIGAGTGQRWSDFSRYTPSCFRVSPKGIPLLEIHQKKTGKRVVVPLNIFPWLIPILEKYDYKSPKISEQKFNKIIKEICRKSGVTDRVTIIEQYIGMTARVEQRRIERWTEISSHCCRRSFATILYREGFTPAQIMKLTGHSTESVFFKYIGIQAEQNAEDFGLMIEKIRSESSSYQSKLKAI